MPFQFTKPSWLLLLPFVVGWVVWLALKSDVHAGPGRRRTALALRRVIASALVLATAGF